MSEHYAIEAECPAKEHRMRKPSSVVQKGRRARMNGVGRAMRRCAVRSGFVISERSEGMLKDGSRYFGGVRIAAGRVGKFSD
jgi:hypothetical protein